MDVFAVKQRNWSLQMQTFLTMQACAAIPHPSHTYTSHLASIPYIYLPSPRYFSCTCDPTISCAEWFDHGCARDLDGKCIQAPRRYVTTFTCVTTLSCLVAIACTYEFRRTIHSYSSITLIYSSITLTYSSITLNHNTLTSQRSISASSAMLPSTPRPACWPTRFGMMAVSKLL